MDFRRKANRLRGYDYSANGVYFITICTENKACFFGRVICGDTQQGTRVKLSETGILVKEAIEKLPGILHGVTIHNYVIMPNHLHLLMKLDAATASLSSIINYFKGYITRRTEQTIWQKSFYDHIVRDEEDYYRIWEYIDNNPGKWLEDKYYAL